ncbi:MAG: DJ-1/PfpI family protein [Bavariicoccus seileri]|uniref:DJ-1/PfpI family protein n=1 Tax=Bavariicoccus seileri TaxID=549685 RepID=UPI0003B681CB|nr:DJ-1/PfpI family protein [Bavariicoccus seileri]
MGHDTSSKQSEVIKEVLVLLTDEWADWEIAHATPEINADPQYQIKVIGVDLEPKISIGGLKTIIEDVVARYDTVDSFNSTALILLPGGYGWGKYHYPEIVSFLQKAQEAKIPIAAICGATVFLGKNGFLDEIQHSGDEKDYYLEKTNHRGADLFLEKQVVTTDGFITANETAALEFAYEILKLLKIRTPDELRQWFDYYRHGLYPQ